MSGLIGKKIGMTSVYTADGQALACTVIEAGPCVVTQVRTEETDGYKAVQLGFGEKKEKHTTQPLMGHFKKAGTTPKRKLVEFKEFEEGLALGQALSVTDVFVEGDFVDVVGTVKGRGFQGSVRRWGFNGGPATHGSKFHRRPGSSGNRTWPGRVMPGKKFPGHLGDETVTVKNVVVVDVLANEGVLVVKGPVPGAKNSLVRLAKV